MLAFAKSDDANECFRHSSYRPEFVLALDDGVRWRLWMLVVREAEVVRGVVYLRERKVGGFPSGLLFGDGTVCPLVVSEYGFGGEVLNCVVESLMKMPGVLSLRLRILNSGPEIRSLPKHFRIGPIGIVPTLPGLAPAHRILLLPGKYEDLLQSLGYTTRRNFRYYRRRFESAGHSFVEDVPLAEFRDAVGRLWTRSVRPPWRVIEKWLNTISNARQPLRSGLRAESGELLSIIGGWIDGEKAIALFQLNNELDAPQLSLSTVLRGYLIESLIQRQIPKLAFWGGGLGHLMKHADFPEVSVVCVDSRAGLWQTVKRVIGVCRNRFPPRLRRWASWISPPDVSRH